MAQILDFLSTQTALPIVGISGGSAIVIPYKVRSRPPAGGGVGGGEAAPNQSFTSQQWFQSLGSN